MAKGQNKKQKSEKSFEKAKKVTPYHQSLLDAIVLAKSENDTSKIKMLSKIIKKLENLAN